MDGSQNEPGISLFQGSESLHLNPDTQREEEEEAEAIADQRRRDQELQNLLTNAFDDLYDDDDQSTLNSSHHLGSTHQDEDEDHDEGSFQENTTSRYHAAHFGRPEHNNQYISVEDGAPNSQQINEHAPPDMNESPPADTLQAREQYMNSRNLAESQNRDLGAGGDASVSLLHYQHCYRTSPAGYDAGHPQEQNTNERYLQTGYNSVEQLQVLYEVRVREVHRLVQQLELQEHEAAQEKDQLYRKLALREAEKERAQMLHKQAQSLLVEHKEKITELEKQMGEFQATVTYLEKSKSELTHQLEVSQASMMDLHTKISLLERGNLNNTDKHMDAFLRNVQATHSKELKRLENQLESAVTKLSKKEHDLEELQTRTQELVRKHDALMVDKGETINQLSRSLEESQRQCQQLMGSTVGQETVRLRVQLETAVKDKEELQRNQKDLMKELESFRSDLQQYEAVAKMGLFCPDESVDETDSMVQLGIHNRNKGSASSNGMHHMTDLNAKLRDELQRCLIGQKLKREEIARLKAQLTMRDQTVTALQKQEAQYLVEVEKLKGEYVVLIEELNSQRELAKKSLEQRRRSEEAEVALKKLQAEEAARAELEMALSSAREQCDKQTQLNEQLQQEMAELRQTLDEDRKQAIDQYSEEYLQFHDKALARLKQERDREHEALVASLRYELEDARKESDRVKQLYIEMCGSKEELVSQLQEERKASQELATQLQKLEAEMRAYDDAERARATHHEAALLKLKSEKDKLEAERRALDEVQALQRELEGGKAEHEAAMLKLQEEKEKLEAERKALGEVQALQRELELEKANARAQHKAAILKLRVEKEALEAERKAVGKARALQSELEVVKTEVQKLKLQHEAAVQRLMNEKDKAVREVEEKARQLYTTRVTEEIEKAKTEALAELEKDRSRRCAEQDSHRVKQLEAECHQLRREIQALARKHSGAAADLTAKLKQQKQQLEEQEKQLNKPKPTYQNASTSPIHDNVDAERIRRELTLAFNNQLSMLQTKHQLTLEETTERVKDETVRFFAEQIRQAESRHRTDLQRVEQAHKESVAALRKALMEERTRMQAAMGETEGKLKEEHARLQKVQEALVEERARIRDDGCWKARAEALAGRLEEIKRQAFEAERNSQMFHTKYRTAKKTVYNYKAYAEAKEKHLNSEWQRINLGFQQALEQVQNRLEALLKTEGGVSNSKVAQCTEQIKELREKLN